MYLKWLSCCFDLGIKLSINYSINLIERGLQMCRLPKKYFRSIMYSGNSKKYCCAFKILLPTCCSLFCIHTRLVKIWRALLCIDSCSFWIVFGSLASNLALFHFLPCCLHSVITINNMVTAVNRAQMQQVSVNNLGRIWQGDIFQCDCHK